MPFPTQDPHWTQTRDFLQQYAQTAAILAPNEFLEFLPGTYHYNVSYLFSVEQFDFIVVHKGMVTDIETPLLLTAIEQFHPVFANDVFVVYAKEPIADLPPPDTAHVQPLINQLQPELEAQAADTTSFPTVPPACAAVITTYNRPNALRRSLPQIVKLGLPIVIIDDGSAPGLHRANQSIANEYNVPLIRIPTNRGLPNAINVGVEYWLADPSIQWISYFQDDVDVSSNTLRVLTAIQHPQERPILAGQEAPEHPIVETTEIAGYTVLLKRSMPGQHLHAHRDYWRAILPIPTPYLGAPKQDKGKPGQGADEDWWITAWAPQSIAKQGRYVVCIPNLVRTFQPAADESTWGNISGYVSSTEEAESLSLEGVKVLVDGYNLQLTKGTGIKTYGFSLIQALDRMGAKVDVLLSRNGYKANEVLDEIIFFDNQSGNQNWLNLSKWVIKSLSPFYRAKRRKPFAGLVVKRGKYSDDFLRYAESFNLPQCYDLANGLYQKLQLTTKINVSEKIDLWHATYPLPMQVRGARKITTIHDLIPLRLPYATLDDKRVFYLKIRDALKDSEVIITVSENSKQDILRYFDVDPDKIFVTYQPIALKPLEDTEEGIAAVLGRYGLKPQNYLMFVGAIEPKKNLGRLLDAYSSLDTDMPLVIVGKKGWLWEEELGKASLFFDNKDSKKKVKLFEYVSMDLLRYLYKGAFCLAFPSLYEGFGLPPVEAMHYGCPVVTSNVSCLPEICGDAALYVDPYDFKDIQEKLEMVMGDTTLREQMIKTGHQTAENFSLDNYTRRLYQAYTRALK
jgi:glycosyltransferase involved in cell wall biosynthesis